jgi:osmotically-inducible protein OsmY
MNRANRFAVKMGLLIGSVMLTLSSINGVLADSGSNNPTASAQVPTLKDQSSDPADQKATRDVRQALANATDLSPVARKIVVVTTSGRTIWLKGKVETPSERHRVLALAMGAARSYKVRMFLQLNR